MSLPDDSKPDNNKDEYALNLDGIFSSKLMPSVVKNAAYRLKSLGYFLVEDFFKELNDQDLNVLIDIAHVCHVKSKSKEDQIEALQNMIILTKILSEAEGYYINMNDQNELQDNILKTIAFITAEGLYRKSNNIFDISYKNFTYENELTDNLIILKDDNEGETNESV